MSVRRPLVVLAAWAVVAAASTLGVLKLEFATTPSSYLDRLSTEWSFYQETLDRFGGDEIIVIAFEGGKPFDPEALDRVVRMSRSLEELPGVRRVDSLATLPIVRVDPDGTLDLSPALDGRLPTSSAGVAAVRRALAMDRLVSRSLVSDDGTTLAVNVLLEGNSDGEQARVIESAYGALGDTGGWVSGVPIYEYRVGRSTKSEILRFVPATLLLMAVLMLLVFRSPVAVAVPALTSGVGAWVVLGLMGALGEPITMTGMVLPSVLLALGTAYVMHLLVAARGQRSPEQLIAALVPVAMPIVLSGLTTAVGFFAIMTVRIDAIRSLGAYGGVGVLVVLAASLTLGPAILSLRPLSEGGGGADSYIRNSLSPRLMGMLGRWRVPVLLVWLVVFTATAMGIGRLYVETDAVRWWPSGSEMRDHYDSIRDRLSGISPMNVVIRSRGDRSITDPEVLARIDEFSRYLEGLPDVGKVVTVADPLRQLHGGFNGDPDQPLPDRKDLIAQYLLLLESVDPIHDVVSRDRTTANVLLRLDDNGSRFLLDVAEAAEAWWHESGLDDFDARTTGIMFEFARSEESIAWGQIRGLSLALVAIGGILLLLFRSPAVAGIALVPNLASLGLIYGAMGLLGIPLDAGTVCMGSLALGIAVDDTIHVVAGFREHRRYGDTPRLALEKTLRRILPALIYTTVAVAVGFAVLAFSEFLPTRNLGRVTTLVVMICLVADTTLLPAVLLRTDEEVPGADDAG